MTTRWSACSARGTSCSTSSRASFDTDIHVRGNEITVTGPAGGDRARRAAVRGADQPARERRRAHRRRGGAQRRRMLRRKSRSAPGRGADPGHPVLARPHDPAQDAEPEALRRRDRQAHDRVLRSARPAPARPTWPWPRRCKALQAKEVNRIILTRPAVEAGERLGFLPGTLYEKIDPYLRPLYDALHDMVDPDSIPRLIAAGHDRGRAAGLHARPDAERLVHHPGRGAEHLGRADEDVPDPARASAPRSWSPATSPRSTCPPGRAAGCGWSRTSWMASTTSTSPG